MRPLQRRNINGLDPGPGIVSVDDLGLVETADGFGRGVVIAVADAADRWLHARVGQPFDVRQRKKDTARPGRCDGVRWPDAVSTTPATSRGGAVVSP